MEIVCLVPDLPNQRDGVVAAPAKPHRKIGGFHCHMLNFTRSTLGRGGTRRAKRAPLHTGAVGREMTINSDVLAL